MKNLILFGAGASYGSDQDKSAVPALASNLHQVLVNKYNDLKNDTVATLAPVFEKDFEQGILELYKKAPHFLSVYQRCMAHYFFQYGSSIPIKKNNLYFRLANHIKSRANNIALASLNYERMLEISFLVAGINLFCNKSQIQNSLELCLPHGCCNIFCDSIRASSSGISFSAMNISTSGQVSSLSDPDKFENRIRNDAFPPVMSYFEPSKMTTSGANFITSQRARLQELILKAEKILIIGIRVRKHDTHIWSPLQASSAQIIYCSGPESVEEFKIWQENGSRKNDIIRKGYFDQEFEYLLSQME